MGKHSLTMTSATASQSSPNVQHDFDGDARILNATFERRGELRRVLTALAQDLQKIEGRPTRIQAQIKASIAPFPLEDHSELTAT